MMDKKDAIDYLLYMKHDVQAGSPVDVAIDTAIEVLKQSTVEPEGRRGRWILCKDQYNVDNDNGNYAYYCSCCKHQDVHAKSAKVSFCWNCGAKMDLRTPTEVDLDIVDSVMMGDIKHGD